MTSGFILIMSRKTAGTLHTWFIIHKIVKDRKFVGEWEHGQKNDYIQLPPMKKIPQRMWSHLFGSI